MTEKIEIVIISDFHLSTKHTTEPDYKKWCDEYLYSNSPEQQIILMAFSKIQGNLIWDLKKKLK